VKAPAFDPILSPDELSLFKDYQRRRRTSGIRELKHHAESMLELYRPSLWKVYKGVKDCRSIREIALEMRSTPKTIKTRQILAHEWLRLALCDQGPVKKIPRTEKLEAPLQLSFYEKVY
jgi:hypothetical protein